MSSPTTAVEVRTEDLGALRMSRADLATLVSRADVSTAVGAPGTGVEALSLVRGAPGGPAWLPLELHYLAATQILAVTEPQT